MHIQLIYRELRSLGMLAAPAFSAAKTICQLGITAQQYVAAFGLGPRPRNHYSRRQQNQAKKADARYLASLDYH